MLTLICGQPRAGKTTYSQRLGNVIHLDECRSYERVRRKVSQSDGDVVVEGVYRRAQDRTTLLNAYKGHGAKCIWLDTPDDVRRNREGWDKLCDRPFEPPTYDEGWDEIIVIRGDEVDAVPRD